MTLVSLVAVVTVEVSRMSTVRSVGTKKGTGTAAEFTELVRGVSEVVS